MYVVLLFKFPSSTGAKVELSLRLEPRIVGGAWVRKAGLMTEPELFMLKPSPSWLYLTKEKAGKQNTTKHRRGVIFQKCNTLLRFQTFHTSIRLRRVLKGVFSFLLLVIY